MLRTEAIRNFLMAKTHSDLAALYAKNMEVQVIVAQGNGERVESDFKGKKNNAYTDGIQTWHPIRIPRNANLEPVDNDGELRFDIAQHAEGIGMTGWDWQNKVSRWFGYDFDGIVGHSARHSNKLNEAELAEVEKAVVDIPWVTVRRSTGGNGRHLYVFVPEILTENHNEHAALARAVLGMMSGLTSFDFKSKVDICGGNMWVWHRKMNTTNRGLELIKNGVMLYDIPVNWRDHVSVIVGKNKKIVPFFIEESGLPDSEKLFMELTGQQAYVPFDEEHKKLITWLNENEFYANYDADHHMVITHTYGLKKAHESLGLKGLFDTVSTGNDLATPNAYMFPLRRGAWSIRRYTPGVQESNSWDQDGAGWTRCFINKDPDLKIAAKTHNGLEHPNGGFVFSSSDEAQKAALMLGADLSLPHWALNKKTKLKENKEGKLIAELDFDPTRDASQGGLKGWIAEGKTWKRVFTLAKYDPVEEEVGSFDDIVRHMLSPGGINMGWSIKANGRWQDEPLKHIEKALKSLNYSPKETESIVGQSIFKAWAIVNLPFQPEYPGDRQWNRNAAQFRFPPSQNLDNLNYPTWNLMLNHIGGSLNEALNSNSWAKKSGIKTGADYLKCWIASLFQFPNDPLPYLFLYGPENTGKSSFHEAISLLVINGVKRADNALTSQGNFNAELENAILGVVEETNLQKNKAALNLIKDWVTSPIIPIHRKNETPYDIPNTTHWIQTSNELDACPIFPGDTRITMLYVPPITSFVGRKEFKENLIKEAPDFMAELLNLEIPASGDRLNIPVINTDEKRQAQRANQSALISFIQEECFPVPGELILFREFVDKFHEWLDPNEVYEWSKTKIGKELPQEYPHARITANNMGGQFYIGNLSFDNVQCTKPRYIVRNSKLVPDREPL